MVLVIPGISSNGIPAKTSASASSAPLPKIYGSPPFNRAIIFPSFALVISNCVISSWGEVYDELPFFPT